MLWKDKKFKKISAWKFVPGPLAKSTYYDDATQATGPTKRQYAVHQSRLSTVSLVDWANFLRYWSSQDLDNAAKLMRAPCAEVLSQAERDIYQALRGFRDVMLLEEGAGLKEYQDVLKRMYSMGLVNLSLTPVAHDQHTRDAVSLLLRIHTTSQQTLLCIQAKKRSLVASNREMKKKIRKMGKELDEVKTKLAESEEKLLRTEKLLRIANAQLAGACMWSVCVMHSVRRVRVRVGVGVTHVNTEHSSLNTRHTVCRVPVCIPGLDTTRRCIARATRSRTAEYHFSG